MDPSVRIALKEWETRRPGPGSGLEGRVFHNKAELDLAEKLSTARLLEMTELRAGLMLRSFSYVGRVQVGEIEITIRPKIDSIPLLHLLRYAYGFRRLTLLPEASQCIEHAGFQDLLVSQLNAEVCELIARGLQRTYVPRKDWLPSPRGRIEIGKLAARGGILSASLPCTHHPKIEDSMLNQILRAGLELGSMVATDLNLRRESKRLATLFQEWVSPLRLHTDVLVRGFRHVNRLTFAYDPAIKIIALLWNAHGITLNEGKKQPLPGFLFDMNRFFQALLSRFLRENLPEHAVRDEYPLRGVIEYVPDYNPRSSPRLTPRPDFVIMRGPQVEAILDAKYRDLWAKRLPREMLYQLALYAAAHKHQSSTILYPTTDESAKEARVTVAEPVFGRHIALVCLRPVKLSVLVELVMTSSTAAEARRRRQYAEQLAFGL